MVIGPTISYLETVRAGFQRLTHVFYYVMALKGVVLLYPTILVNESFSSQQLIQTLKNKLGAKLTKHFRGSITGLNLLTSVCSPWFWANYDYLKTWLCVCMCVKNIVHSETVTYLLIDRLLQSSGHCVIPIATRIWCHVQKTDEKLWVMFAILASILRS